MESQQTQHVHPFIKFLVNGYTTAFNFAPLTALCFALLVIFVKSILIATIGTYCIFALIAWIPWRRYKKFM